MENLEINPVKYGVLWERVTNMDAKMDKMERQIDELLELANKSRGGFWMGMAVASLVGGFMTWVANHWKA